MVTAKDNYWRLKFSNITQAGELQVKGVFDTMSWKDMGGGAYIYDPATKVLVVDFAASDPGVVATFKTAILNALALTSAGIPVENKAITMEASIHRTGKDVRTHGLPTSAIDPTGPGRGGP
jgi:hypothetical protein